MEDKSFIRGIWGIPDINNTMGRWYSRRTKIENDITLAQLNPYAPPCRVYIFGEENFKKMTDMGFDTVLVDKKPCCWDMEKEQYRHKIEIWNAGLKDFKEVVFLDWDCVPAAPVPNDFWDVLGKGEKIRATIYMYHTRHVPFRRKDGRKVSASTFVYVRGKEVVEEIIAVWERMGRPWREEVALSKYIDELNGGWKGKEDYLVKYEPPYHTLYYHYGVDYMKNVMLENNIFFHLNHHKVRGLLGDGKVENIKKRLDDKMLKEKTRLQNILQVQSEKKP